MKEIALHVMDIAENGIAAGAGAISITINEEGIPAFLTIRIGDDGKGMDEEDLKRVADPFYTSRTTRRVGMGVPLLMQHAEMAGGRVEIRSEPGLGTEVEATFMKGHPDRQPLGDVEGCWMLLASANPGIEWSLRMESSAGHFEISTSEIRAAMEIEVISGTELVTQLKRMIRNNIDELELT
ncbi:MAG: sensor histidine kinase [Bacteroidetes bacterium]|nr:sensor histidine kinase [Bacteroidota bacterium]